MIPSVRQIKLHKVAHGQDGISIFNICSEENKTEVNDSLVGL